MSRTIADALGEKLTEPHQSVAWYGNTGCEEVEFFKFAHSVASTPQIYAVDKGIGGKSDLSLRLGVRMEASDISYAPLVPLFLVAGLMALRPESSSARPDPMTTSVNNPSSPE
jgi:acetylornithine/succinyldiaminopimelate/putrescine aminotransferase